MKLPDLMKETKKLRLSIWHVGRQPNKWEDYLYFYIQSRYKAAFCLVRMQITPRERDVNRCEEF